MNKLLSNLALILSVILLALTACDGSNAGASAAATLAASVDNFQPLQKIDPNVFKTANQYSTHLEEINHAVADLQQTLDQIANRGLQAKFSADVGPDLSRLIEEFNQKITEINKIQVTAGLDDKTLSQVEGLLMIIERGVKVGLDAPTLKTLDGLRLEMGNQPNRWQGALQNTIKTLGATSSDVAKEVAAQLQAVLETAQNETSQILREATVDVKEVIASGGAEGRCNADYLAEKVNAYIGDGLINRIKSSILGQGVPATNLLVSGVCSFIPDKLTLVPNGNKIVSSDASLRVWGYGFTSQNRPQVEIRDPEGKSVEGISKISVLITTRYQIQIDLQGIDFSKVGNQYRFMLIWPNLLEPNELLIQLPSTPTPTPLPPTPTFTATSIPKPIAIARQGLNIRSGPSTGYIIIGAANQGDQFDITGKSEDGAWWRIALGDGGSGYIFAGLVDANNAGTVPSVADPEFTVTPVPPPTATNIPTPIGTPTPTPLPIPPTTCPTPSSPGFRASPPSIEEGQSTTLSWDPVANVDSLSIDDGAGPIPLGLLSSTVVQPRVTTIYRLIAQFCGKSEPIAETRVVVNQPVTPIPPPLPIRWILHPPAVRTGREPDHALEASSGPLRSDFVITGVGGRVDNNDNFTTLAVQIAPILPDGTIGARVWRRYGTVPGAQLEAQAEVGPQEVVVGVGMRVDGNGNLTTVKLYARKLDPVTGALGDVVDPPYAGGSEPNPGMLGEVDYYEASEPLIVVGLGVRVNDDNVTTLELRYGSIGRQ